MAHAARQGPDVRRARRDGCLRAPGPRPVAAPYLAQAARGGPCRAAGRPLARGSGPGSGGMRPARAVLNLSPGAGVVLDGTEWTVERREPHLGRVQLVRADGA